MSDGHGIETYANHGSATSNGVTPEFLPPPPRTAQDIAMQRALVLIGIAAGSAGLAYWIVRASLKAAAPADPTTARIQQLIDEANRLLKQLDEKKPD